MAAAIASNVGAMRIWSPKRTLSQACPGDAPLTTGLCVQVLRKVMLPVSPRRGVSPTPNSEATEWLHLTSSLDIWLKSMEKAQRAGHPEQVGFAPIGPTTGFADWIALPLAEEIARISSHYLTCSVVCRC